MKLSELSELHLAAVVAGATFLGGVGSALISTVFIDAGTERQTNVQLMQLAIGILSEPITEGQAGKGLEAWTSQSQTSQTALRTWAVDMINQTAEVKFDEDAKHLLVNGQASFPMVLSGEILKGKLQALGFTQAPVVEVASVIVEPTP